MFLTAEHKRKIEEKIFFVYGDYTKWEISHVTSWQSSEFIGETVAIGFYFDRNIPVELSAQTNSGRFEYRIAIGKYVQWEIVTPNLQKAILNAANHVAKYNFNAIMRALDGETDELKKISWLSKVEEPVDCCGGHYASFESGQPDK